MLSRSAEGLFWLGRYIERAENVARLIDAACNIDNMPQESPLPGTEWSAILIAAGCRDTFQGDIETSDGPAAIRHLLIDPQNPSSIFNSFECARSNARAQRVAITQEVWTSVNEGWREIRDVDDADCTGGGLSRVLDRVRALAADFRGAVAGTQLRNAGFDFLRLGESLERADATARLLDVKYHVLLPETQPVGGGYDQLQWNNLLRAAGVRSAYKWAYRAEVSAELVVDFLALNRQCPRSLHFCYASMCRRLDRLCEKPSRSREALGQACDIRATLSRDTAKEMLAFGLHEYLTDKIVRTNTLAQTIGADFGFGSVAAQTQQQTQS